MNNPIGLIPYVHCCANGGDNPVQLFVGLSCRSGKREKIGFLLVFCYSVSM